MHFYTILANRDDKHLMELNSREYFLNYHMDENEPYE